MAAWFPTTPFEDEVLALQPDHNFIYGHLTALENRRNAAYQSRPRQHLDYLQRQKDTKEQTNNNEVEMPDGCSLGLIRKVHQIAGTKQMGMDASIEDWDTPENAGRETIALIRHFGMGPSVDLPFNKKTTLPTLPIEKRKFVIQNGKQLFPVLLDGEDFKVVSTRMRNAESAKAIKDELNDSDDNKTEKVIKALLCDEEHLETLEEAREREQKEFLAEYPTLDQQQKTKSSKQNQQTAKARQEPANWRVREPENWRSPNTSSSWNTSPTKNWHESRRNSQASSSYSSITNLSANSDSSLFLSLNNTSSSDEYASAKEYLDNSFNNNKNASQSYAKIVQHADLPKQERLPVVDRLPKGFNNARFYKPKDVYNLKNRNQRQMF